MPNISFQVSPRLTELLSESYSSTELALRELVDNAWDADATKVEITLPEAMTSDPVIIKDNGAGMHPEELEQEYFKVARDRRKSKGTKTTRFKRKCRGRKGIGKFAGLMVADAMELETTAQKKTSVFTIRKSTILEHAGDLENFPIQNEVSVSEEQTGTTITLSDLNQNFSLPNPEKLKSILIRSYRGEADFEIYVDEELVSIADFEGAKFIHTIPHKDAKIELNVVIAEGKKKIKDSGLVTKINGKVCGSPSHFGLEEDDILPRVS